MALTTSRELDVGSPMPGFRLTDVVSGATVDAGELAGERGTLVMFICNHCPFVKHVRDEIGRLGNECLERGLGVAAINANDYATYPDDAPGPMKEIAEAEGWRFPYLVDESQEAARRFGAVCTPEFYLFDGDRRLVYHGQLDGSRPGNDVPVTGEDLRLAIDALLSGGPIPEGRPSAGCNIKWKPGSAPEQRG